MKRLPDEPRNEVPLKVHDVLLQVNREDEALGGAREGEFEETEVEVRNALVRAAAEKERASAAMAAADETTAAALDTPNLKHTKAEL